MIVVTGLMIVLLPVLAFLQYHWLGRIAEQELDRMRKNLHTAALQFSFDMSRDIVRLTRVTAEAIMAQPFREPDLRDVRRRWADGAEDPLLVTDSIVTVDGTPLPQDVVLPVNGEWNIVLSGSLHTLTAVRRVDGTPSAPALLIDTTRLFRTIIPRLFRAHFSRPGDEEYDLVITAAEEEVLYSSVPAPRSVIDGADVHIPLLALASVERRPREEEEGMPMRRGPEFEERRFHRQGPEREFRRENPMEPGERPGPPQAGFITLHLRHRNGSLEALVQTNRWRNIGVSLFILVLLGASVGFLLVTSHRSRLLAQQQMEFVAGISHELRTPLAALKAAGENLADGLVKERAKQTQYGQLIRKEVLRLTTMVDRTLTFAALQSGKRSIERSPVDLRTVVQRSVEQANELMIAPGAGPQIELSLPERECIISGNAALLQSAVFNLISNAVKYGGKEGTTSVTLRRSGGNAEIIVADNGIGIPAKDLPHIFDPFFRAQNAAEQQFPGNGLGLSIVHGIVQQHDGTVRAESTEQRGSRFIVHLPIV